MKRFRLLQRGLLTAAAMLMGLISASAATNLGQVNANEDYSVPGDWGTFDAYYVAPTDGPTVISSNMELKFFSDAAGSNEVEGYTYEYKGGKDVFTYENLPAGTYYLHLNFVMNDGTFRIETEASAPTINLLSVLPEPNSGFSPAINDVVSFTFDLTSVKYTEAAVVVGEKSYPASSNIQVGMYGYVNVYVGKKIVELVNERIIREGETFKVRLTGVCDGDNESIVLNENGVAEVQYTLGSLPTTLAHTNITLYDALLGEDQVHNPFKSYYRPGNEDAIITLEFSDDIQTTCTPQAIFSIGDSAYESKYYTDTVEGTINGNKVTFDMSGLVRHYNNWPSGLYKTTDPAGLKITGVIDVNGNPVYSGDPASPNSFTAILDMNYLEYPVSAVFTPEEFTTVSDGAAITMNVANGQHITFDNVKVSYYKQGVPSAVVIPLSSINVENGDNDSTILTFTLPEIGADDASAVTVALTNILCDDGFSYTVSGVFNNSDMHTTATFVSPADGASLANIKDAGQFRAYVANIPECDELEVIVTFFDPNLEDPQITTYMAAADPEEGLEPVYNYAQEIFEDYDMLAGTDYTLTVTVKGVTYPEGGGRVVDELCTKSITLHGTAAPFVYSDVELVRLSPNPVTTDIISTDQNTITVFFSAPAVVTKAGTAGGMGSGLISWTVAKYEGSTILNEELEEVEVVDGTVWTISIPESVISNSKSSIPVSLWAVDTEGHPIYKTTIAGLSEPYKNKDNTYFNFDYICTVGAPDFVVEPSDPDEDGFTVVEQLDKFYVSYSAGISPSCLTSEKVALYKGKGANQELIKEWDSDYFDMWNDDVCVDYNNDVNLKWAITLDNVVTEPGAYALVFPNAFFNLGSEFNQSLSRLTTARYLIEAAVEADNVTTDPAVGSTVDKLDVIKITWVDAADAAVEWNATDPINVYDEDNNIVTTAGIDASEDFDDPWNMLIITLSTPVVESGNYTVVLPAGKVLLNDGAKSASAQTLKYTVKDPGETTGINSIVVDGKVIGDVYSVNGVRVLKAGENVGKLDKGIYIINGKKVVK